MIHTYRTWKGEDFVSQGIPTYIKWSCSIPWENTEPDEEEIWRIIAEKKARKAQEKTSDKPTVTRKKSQGSAFVTAQGTKTLHALSNETKSRKKRKSKNNQDTTQAKKKIKQQSQNAKSVPTISMSRSQQWSFIWSDNSCAYDSLYSIILQAIASSEEEFIHGYCDQLPLLNSLVELYQNCCSGHDPVEKARDAIRSHLHSIDPIEFPMNTAIGTEINLLCSYMFGQETDFYHKQYRCRTCDIVQNIYSQANLLYNDMVIVCSPYRWRKQGLMTGSASNKIPVQWMRANMKQITTVMCQSCHIPLVNHIAFTSMPLFFRFKVDGVNVKWTLQIDLQQYQYRLCGFIYYGNNHFTSRIITPDGEVWFNDAIQYGRAYYFEKKFQDFSVRELSNAPQARKLILAFYIRI